MNKFFYSFRGKTDDDCRDVFVHQFIVWACNVLREVEGVTALMILFVEIVRNIYEHAEGQGEAEIRFDKSQPEFIIFDYGKECFDIKTVIARGSTKSDGCRGNGLCGGLIQVAAIKLGIELTIDTSRGFCYIGKVSLPLQLS